MSLLEQHLGRVLTASDVSEYLRCDISTVYRHFRELGGVKIGTSYKFFERSFIQAVSVVDIPQSTKEIPSQPAAKVSQQASKPRRKHKAVSRVSDPHGLL
jgi:hypothetical protein